MVLAMMMLRVWKYPNCVPSPPLSELIFTYFRLRLSWTTHSTSSHRQLPQGAPSTTSQRTLRARHDTQARAARRFVTLPSEATDVRFFGDAAVSVVDGGAGGGDMELATPGDDRGDGVESPLSDIVEGLYKPSNMNRSLDGGRGL